MSDHPTLGMDAAAASGNEVAGGWIGPFRIVKLIGEGGFGSVYEAEQEQPVKRRVALKIIKLGMDTREVIVRFEAERQALALMDHPHIARVLDAGATMSGRPYFVMELVQGEPIAAYCARRGLSIAQRLQLFDQVCAAVQHAHTKGIIHRDLKPNNVLVSTHDDQPFAKVIDFGIAKATSGRLTDKTLFTEQFLMMGTPLYMSPEQAEGSADIDTRTDIYALGVILYELLTDSTPLDSNTLRSAGYAEIQRIIREVEPPPPSARLAQPVTTRVGADIRPREDSRTLSKTVRGELDWIVMKAIDKDRSRRYETASALALDLRRFLAGEPVLAAPPGTAYRIGKFVRRHKGAVAAGSLVAMSLVAGIAGFAWQAHIAREQALIAQQQTRLAQQQTALAEKRSHELEQVANFEATMLVQVDPTAAGQSLSDGVIARFAAARTRAGASAAERERDVAAFEAMWRQVNATDAARDLIDATVLKPAVAAIDKQFKEQPLVDAFLRQVIADRYSDMGLGEAAMPLQQSALATRRRLLGDDDPVTLSSMNDMAVLLERQGRSAEAEPFARQAYERGRRVLGADHPATLQALLNLGLALYDGGRLAEAEAIYRETLATQRRVLGNDDPNTLAQVHNLGLLLMYEHKLDQAEPFLREAQESFRRTLGENHANTLTAVSNYGFLLERQGRLDQAEAIERDALSRSRTALGEDHPLTLTVTTLLGMVLEKKGAHAEAERLLAPVDAANRKAFTGTNLFLRGMYLVQLGLAHTGGGHFEQAQAALAEAETVLRQTRNVTHADDLRECLRALIALHAAWDRAQPGKGHAALAQEWKAKLDALGAAGPAPPNRHSEGR